MRGLLAFLAGRGRGFKKILSFVAVVSRKIENSVVVSAVSEENKSGLSTLQQISQDLDFPAKVEFRIANFGCQLSKCYDHRCKLRRTFFFAILTPTRQAPKAICQDPFLEIELQQSC